MPRLPYLDPQTAPEPVREALAALPDLRVFRLMANATTCFRPLLRLGAAILVQQKLGARLRELAILHVAHLSRAEYEWIQHVEIARATGASDAQIQAIESERLDAPCFDELEGAVLRFTTELVRDVKPSDAALDALRPHLSPEEIVELVVAVGYYMMLARLMETAEIEPDAPAGTRVLASAR